MSGFANITIMGRVTEDVRSRVVSTKTEGEITIHDLSVAYTLLVRNVLTFYNITL